jgi:hypothetical protein
MRKTVAKTTGPPSTSIGLRAGAFSGTAAVEPSSKPPTTSVALRVSDAHLAELAKIERRLGVQRSALIQMAIAEYIERMKKAKP